MQTRQSIPPAFYRDSVPPPPPPDDPHRCEWPGEDGEGAAGALKGDLAYLGRIYGVPAGVLALCALVAVFFFLAFQHAPL